MSTRLSASPDAAARWLGKGALRELTSAPVKRALASIKVELPLRQVAPPRARR